MFLSLISLAVLVYLIKWFLSWKAEKRLANLKIKWNAVGKDIVILHQIQRARHCPNGSPYPIKLETYLRMHQIKYVVDYEEPMSPKGKTPWITINGKSIADTQLCIEYLSKKFELNPFPGLTENEVAIPRGLRFMVEQDLYWVFAYDRWVHKKGQDVRQYIGPFFPNFPPKIESLFCYFVISRNIGNQAHAQGMGRHSW